MHTFTIKYNMVKKKRNILHQYSIYMQINTARKVEIWFHILIRSTVFNKCQDKSFSLWKFSWIENFHFLEFHDRELSHKVYNFLLQGDDRRGLTEARLPEARLTEARLTEARLTEARLTEARLTEARLTEARLTEARLTEARLTEARLRQDSLKHWLSFRAPGFEHSCAQNGRKTHWGTSACALASSESC